MEGDDAVRVQQCACAALYNLAFDAAITPELEARGAIKLIIDAMKEFQTSAMTEFQTAIEMDGVDEKGDKDMEDSDDEEAEAEENVDDTRECEKKAEKSVVNMEEAKALATQRAEDHEACRIDTQAYCCAALQNFSAHAAHEKAIRDEGAIGCILAAVRAHPLCAPIQLHGVSSQKHKRTSAMLRCAANCSNTLYLMLCCTVAQSL